MRRVRLFSSRFALGLWAALVCAFAFLLLFNAPTAPDAPFSSVVIAAAPNSVYLPTQSFDCVETDQQFQCETTIQKRPLVLTWRKGGASQDDLTSQLYPKNCEAKYDGQAVSCNSQGIGSVIGQPERYEVANLGLSVRQLRTVRQKYWGVNTLQKLSETHLTSIGLGLAILGGVSTACFAWIQPGPLSNLLVSLVCGFGMYYVSLHVLSHIILYDMSGTYETFQAWNRLVQSRAMASGAITTLLVALVLQWLQHRNYRLPKEVVGLVVGIGTAALFSYLTLVTLLWLGYAD